jgi:hypothetical protein
MISMQLAIAVLNRYRDNMTLAGVLLCKALFQLLAAALNNGARQWWGRGLVTRVQPIGKREV